MLPGSGGSCDILNPESGCVIPRGPRGIPQAHFSPMAPTSVKCVASLDMETEQSCCPAQSPDLRYNQLFTPFLDTRPQTYNLEVIRLKACL